MVFVRHSPLVKEISGMVDNLFILGNSVVEFKIAPGATSGNHVFVMGDFSLLEEELGPVLSVIVPADWTVLGVHNHHLQEKPKLMYVHWQVRGNLDDIVGTLKDAFGKTSIIGPLPLQGSKTTLDCSGIANKLGTSVSIVNGPVCDVIISRKDQNIVSRMNSDVVLNHFGLMSAVLEFTKMDNGQVFLMGDFPLKESEVQNVIDVLTDNGAMVTGMHNHMLEETPKLSFNHFEMTGSLDQDITIVNDALGQTSIKG